VQRRCAGGTDPVVVWGAAPTWVRREWARGGYIGGYAPGG
jgi:hypothetical protein